VQHRSTDIPSKKVRASFSPGNDIKTSKDSIKHDTNTQTELQNSQKLEQQSTQHPKGPNLPTEMAKWLETNYYQTCHNARFQ